MHIYISYMKSSRKHEGAKARNKREKESLIGEVRSSKIFMFNKK